MVDLTSGLASTLKSPSVPTTSALTGTSTTLASNFNTFLNLLTTQLKNQNPLSPMDTNQFTQQLVQFAGVEQQLQTNKQLGDLSSAIKAQQTNSALGYLGRTIGYDSSSALAGGGSAAWNFTPNASGTFTAHVKDASGKVVFTSQANYVSGQASTFNWTQGRADGAPVGDQTYTLELLQGSNGSGARMTVGGKGVASGVDFSAETPTITINGQTVPLAAVRTVETAN
jgi:flagellar basal-body rod modification protein FlgD